MKINDCHLSYCTNIHAGKNWKEDFKALRLNFPTVKQAVSPKAPLGLGLRLSHDSSLQLQDPKAISEFKTWLQENDAYVFTMNGFPYGDFHRTVVKANVHAPDWTTDERKDYTIRLFHLLKSLLPDEMDGGISSSPLSYRHWFSTSEALQEATEKATQNILEVISELIHIKNDSGKLLHLDIEPEPDGILETGPEFINWYENYLLPMGIPYIAHAFNTSNTEATALIKQHLCLCYDVCHFAIGYEDHEAVLRELEQREIKVGKIQISAALKGNIDPSGAVKESFAAFNEPTYLHQVVARMEDGTLKRYQDLPAALADENWRSAKEWRAHFHVPISVDDIGLLQSTQMDIIRVLELQKAKPFSKHLEVETYTWEVLPAQLKLPIAQSISNELNWVIDTLA